jgi:formylglycine-generating enzyme required for sulfatase activity
VLDGYVVSCNQKQHCEYANVDPSGWKKWDVWIWIPPGSFQMGSPDNEPGHEADESPIHVVTFKDGFMLMKYEATVAQYESCMAANPLVCNPPGEGAPGCGNTNTGQGGKSDHPQNALTWLQGMSFCAWVAPNGTLPTEAQWEYAAVGPEHAQYPWGDDPEPTCQNGTAVFLHEGCGCGKGSTWPVGSMPVGEAWSGAADMGGNVWEWCLDEFHSSYVGAPDDGSPWQGAGGNTRVIRGGGLFSFAPELRAAERRDYSQAVANTTIGVRCVMPTTNGW